MKILFVCMGNICRSPTAEAVMRNLIDEQGLGGSHEVDSAGTGDWHVGNPPDPRATQAAGLRGITMKGTARQVRADDFDEFDLIVAMDADNHHDLVGLAGEDSKVSLLREYADGAGLDVPDPYYGGEDGFDEVLDIVERNCAALLREVSPGK